MWKRNRKLKTDPWRKIISDGISSHTGQQQQRMIPLWSLNTKQSKTQIRISASTNKQTKKFLNNAYLKSYINIYTNFNLRRRNVSPESEPPVRIVSRNVVELIGGAHRRLARQLFSFDALYLINSGIIRRESSHSHSHPLRRRRRRTAARRTECNGNWT